MLRLKKLLTVIMVMALSVGISGNTYAQEVSADGKESSLAVIQQVAPLNYEEAESNNSCEFLDINNDNFNFQQISGNVYDKAAIQTDLETTSKATPNGIWRINDPVFVGSGNLTEATDIYLVNTTSPATVFLKLSSSNSNLLAVLYEVKSDGTLSSLGFGAYANGSDSYGVLNPGSYAIVIGSSDGSARGSYTLMWNRANPSGANRIINKTSDLSRVVLYYNDNEIRSNGNNIITDLKWEEHETWYLPLGYSARDMEIDNITSKGTYIGSFSSSAPYSTDNALLIKVDRGSYLYFNSYYRNDMGDVVHIMDYFDPSGQKTPRTLGKEPVDSTWGDHYIVIDLNTFKVVEFLSPFNFHYTKDGGRTYSSNVTKIG